MLILLPPSEGKRRPSRGVPMRPEGWPAELVAPRTAVVDALTTLCLGPLATSLRTLGLSDTMAEEVRDDAELWTRPTARADSIYTGVLYEALDAATLSNAARRRATSRLRVVSSVFGLVRPDERIPAYRLSGDVSLPSLGSVAGHWRAHLDEPLRDALGGGLLVDLRSSTYAAFWRPGEDLARRTATVRVLHEHQGVRKVVSHFNKATKGRLVRALLEEGANPRTPARLAEAWRDLGWQVESEQGRTGTRLDVVVAEV